MKREFLTPDRERIEATPASDIRYLRRSEAPKALRGPIPGQPTAHIEEEKPAERLGDRRPRLHRANAARPKNPPAASFISARPTGAGSQLYVRGYGKPPPARKWFYFEIPLDKEVSETPTVRRPDTERRLCGLRCPGFRRAPAGGRAAVVESLLLLGRRSLLRRSRFLRCRTRTERIVRGAGPTRSKVSAVMRTGVNGFSSAFVLTATILSTTSMPSTTSPKIVCFPFKCDWGRIGDEELAAPVFGSPMLAIASMTRHGEFQRRARTHP